MKRNAFVFILTALMVFSFGLANAQDVLDITGPPTGSWDSGTKVSTGKDISWTIHMTVNTDKISGPTNAWEIYISDTYGSSEALDPGPGFTPVTRTEITTLTALGLDGGEFLMEFSIDGFGADTIGWGGYAIMGGILTGTDEDVWTLNTSLDPSLDGSGLYLCIDSCFYPPGGTWMWSTPSGNVYPSWNGPYCYLIENQPNLPAVFDNCPTVEQVFDHTATAVIDFDGADPDPDKCDPPGDGSIHFSMVSGIGDIDAATGVWSYAPGLADVGTVFPVVVRIDDACGAGTECAFDVSFTNNAPVIDCGAGGVVGKGNPTELTDIVGEDVDGDALTYTITGVAPATPVGDYGIDPNTGVLFFNTDMNDVGVWTFTVCVSDTKADACCDVDIEVLATEPWELQIEKTHNTYQGVHETVDVTVNKGSEDMWGFDILIAYDASALIFQTAIEGTIYDLGWEYFTYRYNYNGNCGTQCPSGLLRVVGMAETNNGPNHPDPGFGQVTGLTLFSLDFLVTDDRTFECMYVPIRFYWMDCGDNTISYHELSETSHPYSQVLGVSRYVYDYDYGGEITDLYYGFPTYFGVQDECLVGMEGKEEPIQFVDFMNGGIDIVCADSIDGRGDLNLNGIMNEISDAVLYTNYFVYGLGVFEHYQAQVAASDVNADGITLSVADLVYLIRVVVGDALPYPKIAPIDAKVSFGDAIAVDSKMGAAYIVIEGDVAPTLLADNMEMQYAYDAAQNVTRTLVFSMEANQTFEGEFLNANGNVISIEMATYEGTPVKVDMVPSSFSLNQNYPNPFNPTTVVSFDVPKAVDYTLSVYNITGQEVAVYSGTAEAGLVEIEVDGAGWSSGIYFYKLNAGDFSATKKMVMVK